MHQEGTMNRLDQHVRVQITELIFLHAGMFALGLLVGSAIFS